MVERLAKARLSACLPGMHPGAKNMVPECLKSINMFKKQQVTLKKLS
jgi:hypothetical protein